MIPFGPQLIGQTEKALNALLLTLLSPMPCRNGNG